MWPKPIIYKTGECELLVVPAAHFHHVFAGAVRAACSGNSAKPEALAVELGPHTAAAVQAWLKELMKKRRKRKELPVMLGLLQQNRMLPLSKKEKVFEIQRETGMDLSELSPDVLNKKLDYFGAGLLCLSPTDSIIEAIRCAIELDLPVFGVDLEDTPGWAHIPIMIRDPLMAEKDLNSFVKGNGSFAENQRHEETDGRREIVMAARLKALMTRHRRILFTCGMSHWRRIRSLLDDPAIMAATNMQPGDPQRTGLTRVVVHPVIAIEFMDVFPAVVQQYEATRKSVVHRKSDQPGHGGGVQPSALFEELLEKASRTYFAPKVEGAFSVSREKDLAFYKSFRVYLGDLCLLRQRSVPDLFMAIKAARQTMSLDFVKAITEAFMDFPWAKPEDYPEYPLLSPPRNDPHHRSRVTLTKQGIGVGEVFYLERPGSQQRDVISVNIPFDWDEERRSGFRDLWVRHTWLPWDYLISSMSFSALCAGRRKQLVGTTEPFSGSLLEGIDIKATLRSHSRGNGTLFVKDRVRKQEKSMVRIDDGFPVVWIFEPGDHRAARWIYLYHDAEKIEKDIRDKGRFREVVGSDKDLMVAVVAYADGSFESAATIKHAEISCDRYYGMILYCPIGWHNNQFARWAEMTDFRRNPFCGHSWEDLDSRGPSPEFFQKQGIRKDGLDWPTLMILMALPYGRGYVSVVIPEDYTISPVVFEKARELGVTVASCRLTKFSQSEIERVRLAYMVPMQKTGPDTYYNPKVEEAIGEKQTKNKELYPQHWAELGNDPY